jgi:hypothetical protein
MHDLTGQNLYVDISFMDYNFYALYHIYSVPSNIWSLYISIMTCVAPIRKEYAISVNIIFNDFITIMVGVYVISVLVSVVRISLEL